MALIHTQINQLAANAANPSVGAYAAKVGEDVFAAAGKGVCDATNQYVGAVALTYLLPATPDSSVELAITSL